MRLDHPTLPLRPTTRAAPGDRCTTFAEFFAGIGLVRMGLERCGWTIRFANDIDAEKLRIYEGHFGPAPHYSTDDVHAVARDASSVPDITLATASFPCTDLSIAGARRGLYSGESSAFWGFHGVLEGMGDRRPPLVLLENVIGFLTSREGRDFRDAMREMNRLGYSVDAFTIDAAHFVPQSRPRLFVVCKRGVDAPPRVDVASLTPSPLRPRGLIDAIAASTDVTWSLRELPALPAYGGVRLESILDEPPDDSPEWWSRERADYLLNQMSDRHRSIADRMIAGARWSCGTVFRRVRNSRSMAELRTDGLAGCLRTPKGGSGRQILFQAGGGTFRVRLLNADECARLMGARGFRTTGSLSQSLFGFGDAVCVDAIEWIGRNYLGPCAEAWQPVAKVVRAADDQDSASRRRRRSP